MYGKFSIRILLFRSDNLAGGYWENTTHDIVKLEGDYWSNTFKSSWPYFVYFVSSGSIGVDISYRTFGYSIRSYTFKVIPVLQPQSDTLVNSKVLDVKLY